MYIDIQNGANTATNSQYRVCLNAAKADVATKLGTSNIGSTTKPIYLSGGTPYACGSSLATNITGNAATASKLATSNVGSTGIPVYFSNGIPVSCGNTLNVNITGNAATATKATQDGNGNVISSTYLPLSGGTMTGTIVTPGNDSVVIRPAKNNYDQIGSSSYKFWQIYATTFYGTLSGNASTATKLATARTIRTNLSSTTAPSFDGTANITPGVTGTLGIGNGGTGSTTKKGAWSNLIPYYDAPWSTIAEDTGNNWASLGNSSVTWWPDNANGIYNKPSNWGLAFTISAGPSGSQEMHQLWFSQANGSIYHRGGNGATASSMEANSWAKLWQTGDSVTGAVWNDYAEYRESDCGEFGYVLTEKGDDTLTKTAERLQPFAGVSSDTWGFSQGETDKAKTPIAVAGRVLVYPYQDRNNYKPGDCVCAAPGGTVDIMTREEVREWPDRIVGTVSCVPDYEEWGGGEGADRPAVRVDGRIWIKVR